MSDVPKKLARNGVIIGEFTRIQIIEGLKSGFIRNSDHVWDETTQKWINASEMRYKNFGNEIGSSNQDEVDGETAWGFSLPIIVLPLCILLIGIRTKFKFFHFIYRDGNVLNWTAVALITALFLYTLACHGRVRSIIKFTTGYVLILLSVLMYGVFHTPSFQAYWNDKNPFRDELRYEIWGAFGEEMFPSYELAFAKMNLKEFGPEEPKSPEDAPQYEQSAQGSNVGVRLYDVKRGDEYEITLMSDGYRPLLIDKSVYKFTANEDAETAIAYPDLNFNYSKLRENRQTQFFKIIATVKRNKGTPLTQMQTWQLRQINDCLLIAKGKVLRKNGSVRMEVIKIAPLTLSGFVNENHPAIPGILESALGTNIVDRFSGLQSKSDENVLRQLAAIWAALEDKKLSYSSITETTPSAAKVQHIRLIDDTLRSSQANCVDGSVLFASVAYKIGLDPQLVLSPGHCYVAIRLPSGNVIGIEMTVIGKKSFGEAIEIATTKSKASLENNRAKFDAVDPSTGYMIVSISGCRKLGIQPIPASK
jgi:hypothetical protein